MNRLTMLAAIATAAIGLSFAAVAMAQESPTPQPTGTAAPSLCAGTSQRGGETITLTGRNRITLPGGGNFVVGAGAGSGFTVCYVEGNARVVVAVATCDEVSRDNPTNSDSADYVLDLIVDSCEVIVSPTPPSTASSLGSADVAVTVTPTPSSGGTISPPSTGDAGLR